MTNTTHTPHENAVMGLMRHLTSNDEAKLQSLMDWMAAPLHKPGTKMETGLLLAGTHFNHKFVLAETLADIYGSSALWTYPHNLENRFCSFNADTRLMVVSIRHDSTNLPNLTVEKLKSLISDQSIELNRKHEPPRTIPNHLNMVFLSGDANVFGGCDRRWTIVEQQKPLHLNPPDDRLLSYSNRLERAVALKNLLLKHQISSTALEAV